MNDPPEEIAKRIVYDKLGFHPDVPLTSKHAALVTAIVKALRNEREACAKVAETIPESKFDLDHEPAPTEQQIRNSIAAAIRKGDR